MAEAAVQPFAETAAETQRRDAEDRAEHEVERRLDRLVTESDWLLERLERCNLREQPLLGARLLARMNGFIERVLDELPETLRLESELRGVRCTVGTPIATALDRVFIAQEELFRLRRPRWAAVLGELLEEAEGDE